MERETKLKDGNGMAIRNKSGEPQREQVMTIRELKQWYSSIHEHQTSNWERPSKWKRWVPGTSDTSEQRMLAMSGIMEALTEASVFIIGVYGSETATMDDLVEKVSRTAYRDRLFDKITRVRVSREPDLKRIQGEVATALGLTMTETSETKRAALLQDRIKREQKILVVLQDVNRGFDLGKLGIPIGDDHTCRCKILLTSTSREILSNHMRAHKVIQA